MGKKLYYGVNGVARKVKKFYYGLDGKARKVKKAYIGVGGVARLAWQAGPSLDDLPVGAVVKIKENGTPVEFYVSKRDYENGLNGAGRILLVRKNCYNNWPWNGTNVNAYATSGIDTWLNSTYKNLLDTGIRIAMDTTKFYYTPGNGNTTVTTLQRSIFLLSMTELGQSGSYINVEGTALPIASTLKITHYNGATCSQWTRSPNTIRNSNSWRINAEGTANGNNTCSNFYGSRPAFTLPEETLVDDTGNILG